MFSINCSASSISESISISEMETEQARVAASRVLAEMTAFGEEILQKTEEAGLLRDVLRDVLAGSQGVEFDKIVVSIVQKHNADMDEEKVKEIAYDIVDNFKPRLRQGRRV